MKPIALFFAAFLVSANLWAGSEPPFPFLPPWDDASPGVTNLSAMLEKPAGSHGFVVARDGHFFEGERRIRFFGVNTVFGANFPTHDDATKIAARMAKFGINCVRFHHMDNQSAPTGIWSADKRTLDAGQLDKLDFFIAQLKANGIYADLNLHVSRIYPGMPAWEGAPHYDKGVDNFYPPMIELQRDYARQLLWHYNPYTQTIYAREPAVAMVEINNENGLIHEWQTGKLDALPAPYRDELQTRWNQWLQTQYRSQTALAKAWNGGDEPLGAELLKDGHFDLPAGSAWMLEQHDGAQAEVSNVTTPSGPGLAVEVKETGSAGWHVQLSQSKIALTQGKPYTLTFHASGLMKGPSHSIHMAASQAHAPWATLWSANVELPPDAAWKDYHFTFRPSDSDENARIIFSGMGSAEGEYRFAEVSLRTGGVSGLRTDEQLGAMPVLAYAEFSSRSPEAQRDWMRFLWKTEEDYWTGMERFLKKEIKTRSLIVGTAAGYSPSAIQAKLDAVDAHAYWQHPRFPHKPWDAEDWTVNNVSMAGVPDGGVLPGCAYRRVAGKPFVCTEFNAPAPNSYTSETFLLMNAYAALQDWDGVFAFAYSHRLNDWNPQRIPNFFDIDQHPAKLATLPAAIALFVRGDVARARATTHVPYSPEQALDAVLKGESKGIKALGLGDRAWLETAIQLETGEPSAHAGAAKAPLPAADPEIAWESARSFVTLNTPRSKAFIGQGTGGPVTLGRVTITTPQEWAAITLTVMNGRDFQSPGHILIAAVGNVENTDMHWKNAEKSSVGRDWGKAPVRAWGVGARITLPVPASKLQAWALDERGQRKQPLEIVPGATGGSLDLGGQYQTLWYEIEVKP
jgi:hypothetical protein